MARPRKKKPFRSHHNNKVIPPANRTQQSPEQQARYHLDLHRYKNAMDGFKRLLKQSPDDSQFQLLYFTACQGRCLQLADKKMFNEACVIWENAQRFAEQNSLQPTQQSPHLGDYLQWLLKSDKIHPALQVFLRYESSIKKTYWFPVVQSHFAAYLLVAPEQTLNVLEQHHPLRSHCIEAKKALSAFCNQQFDAMNSALKNIPFRSAFKDFVLILKSQYSPEQNKTVSYSSLLLDKIHHDSAFYPFSQTLQTLNFDNDRIIKKLLVSESQETALLAEYLAWDKTTLKAWMKIRQKLSSQTRLKKESANNVLLQWLLAEQSFKNNPDKEAVIKFICDILVLDAPSNYPSYRRRFGSIANAQRSRIEALISEKQGVAIDEILDDWQIFLQQSDKPLVKALVHRKMAELYERRPVDDFYYEMEVSYTQEYNLLQSLNYDSKDKVSYLKLLALYGRDQTHRQKNTAEQKKARQKVISDALTYFPEDREILILAIKESQYRKAFKKAASLANRLLKIDPTNSFARQMLIDSHLSHARKNLITGKYHLVEKEINLAGNIIPDSPRVILFQGILCFVKKDPAVKYRSLIHKSFELFQNPLLAMLILNTELLTAKMGPKALTQLMPDIDKEQNISSQQSQNWMTELFAQMLIYQNEGNPEFLNAFNKLNNLFKSFSQAIDDQQQRIKISELLVRFKAYPLAKWFIKFDKQLLKKPIMQYYQVKADSHDNPAKVTDSQFKRLEKAFNEASESGDNSVANRLVNLLSDIEETRYFMPTDLPVGFPGTKIDDDDETMPFDSPIQGDLFGMMEEIMGHLTEAEKKELMQNIEDDIFQEKNS